MPDQAQMVSFGRAIGPGGSLPAGNTVKRRGGGAAAASGVVSSGAVVPKDLDLSTSQMQTAAGDYMKRTRMETSQA